MLRLTVQKMLVLNCGFEGSFTPTAVGGAIPQDWTAGGGYTLHNFNTVTMSPVNSGNQALQIGNFDADPVPRATAALVSISNWSQKRDRL
jgi:hypothetical protein